MQKYVEILESSWLSVLTFRYSKGSNSHMPGPINPHPSNTALHVSSQTRCTQSFDPSNYRFACYNISDAS